MRNYITPLSHERYDVLKDGKFDYLCNSCGQASGKSLHCWKFVRGNHHFFKFDVFCLRKTNRGSLTHPKTIISALYCRIGYGDLNILRNLDTGHQIKIRIFTKVHITLSTFSMRYFQYFWIHLFKRKRLNFEDDFTEAELATRHCFNNNCIKAEQTTGMAWYI